MMHMKSRLRTLLALLLVYVSVLGCFSPPLYAKVEPVVNESALRFILDANTLNTAAKGMIVEQPGTADARLVIYYLAPEIGGKARKFNFAAGSIPTSKSEEKGLYAPGIEDISKRWKVENKAPGSNTKVARMALKNGVATFKVAGPGNTQITVSNSGYKTTLPVEVRVPEYSALRLTYGAKKTPKTLEFAQVGSSAGDSTAAMVLDTLTVGDSWLLSVMCKGGPDQIPGLDKDIYFAVDKAGNGFWFSDDPAIASVSSTGKLKAVAEGDTTITFVDYLGRQHRFAIEVKPKPTVGYSDFKLYVRESSSFAELKWDELSDGVTDDRPTASRTLKVGESLTIDLRAKQNNKERKLSFFSYSDNIDIAYIDGSKNVQGLTVGEATLCIVFLGEQGNPREFLLKVTVTE